jgi:hypothetical protein
MNLKGKEGLISDTVLAFAWRGVHSANLQLDSKPRDRDLNSGHCEYEAGKLRTRPVVPKLFLTTLPLVP